MRRRIEKHLFIYTPLTRSLGIKERAFVNIKPGAGLIRLAEKPTVAAI